MPYSSAMGARLCSTSSPNCALTQVSKRAWSCRQSGRHHGAGSALRCCHSARSTQVSAAMHSPSSSGFGSCSARNFSNSASRPGHQRLLPYGCSSQKSVTRCQPSHELSSTTSVSGTAALQASNSAFTTSRSAPCPVSQVMLRNATAGWLRSCAKKPAYSSSSCCLCAWSRCACQVGYSCQHNRPISSQRSYTHGGGTHRQHFSVLKPRLRKSSSWRRQNAGSHGGARYGGE